MRIVLTAIPANGHLTPMVPLAWALRAAGHEVVVAGQPDLVPVARAAGLCAQPIGEPFGQLAFLRERLPEDESPIEAWGRLIEPMYGMASRTWATHTQYTVDKYLEFARSWRPDLVVSEPFEFAGRLVSGALKVPHVRHGLGLTAVSERFEETARGLLSSTADRLGTGAGLPAPDLTLDNCPPTLWSPPADGVRQPMRYIPYNGTGTLPDWAREPSGPRRVCISLGTQTIVLNGMPLLRRLVEAVAGIEGVEPVIAIAASDREGLGPVPSSVRIVESLPLNLFLDRCDVVVHHGGAGTCLTATAFGLPQLVLPQFLDQFQYGDQVAACGAGRTVDTADDQNSVEHLRQAVVDLLDDPSYARVARAVAEEAAAMPSPAQTVARLEQLVAAGA
ncbi:UDP:flavonoid glycosyltransferase YjiC (YdhE family) [Streptomyces olivoverticillatus]|uniref:UDP:flavonoid glycosyltransferase YjiC (YdhE family) n=1 Tax=Streptomyces olivoverticillatus TaxID=66427 RepID=A0A7W7PLE0_9ACTN|nr:nucleotide disphospho-sugar-binding domain-containing protein [Streptomyces olivoverticillatus]MBB4895206.1 UDP:flavonoid glycosyltransferase YjiC (YdhE family) [Streptomyces olivoverticillatus]